MNAIKPLAKVEGDDETFDSYEDERAANIK
jgi:hypothetical protein